MILWTRFSLDDCKIIILFCFLAPSFCVVFLSALIQSLTYKLDDFVNDTISTRRDDYIRPVDWCFPVNTKHLYNIYKTSAQRLRRWSNIV